MKTLKIILPVLLVIIDFAISSKVLMVLPLGSKSHKHIFTPLAESLSAKGHDVMIASMYGESGDRGSLPYRDVVASKMAETVSRVTGDFNVFQMLQENGGRNINSMVMKLVVKNLPVYCDAFLRDPAVAAAWAFAPDLILLPAFMNECGLVFVHRFRVPFVYVTTSGLTPWTADLVGNPEHPAYVPNQYLPYTDDMTLTQRTVNSVMRVVAPMLRRHYVLGRLDAVAQHFLRDPSVRLADVETNVSLVLVNSHHSLGFPRPLQPNVVEVGGMHCRPAAPIDDPRLRAFLDDSADNSVVLFSLGSQIKSAQMPPAFRDTLLRAFARLPYRVVWKWEGAPLANASANVLTRKWLPQQDLLGHRAVGGFFSHGGLLSTQEAIYHGVPLVGLPIMSDQHLNVKQVEAIGVGVGLSIATVTEDDIVEALTRVMEEPSFRTNALRRSVVMRDQETKPLDRATYYTEYVLRHQGAGNLRSGATKLSFISYYLLDVLAVLAASCALVIAVSYLFIKLTFKLTLRLFVRVFESKFGQLRRLLKIKSDFKLKNH